MLKVAPEKHFVAIGPLAHRLRVRAQDIAAVCETWGIVPAFNIGGVPFLTESQVKEIEKHLPVRGAQ